ncbi:MAG TPA: polymer-forming cytoskeletal protein [Gemmatimonadales bacterium]|nr:polymer-forming cytoskeletal protein [Gemmatimonadales bacterium]
MAILTEKGQRGESQLGLSIIAAGMRVTGDIVAEGVVKIEGAVSGTIRAGRQVLVAKGGEVDGDIYTREAVVGGEVRGSIHVEERAELQATSVVHGDITARRLLVQEGGEVNGVVRMGDGAVDEDRALAARTGEAPKLPAGSGY